MNINKFFCYAFIVLNESTYENLKKNRSQVYIIIMIFIKVKKILMKLNLNKRGFRFFQKYLINFALFDYMFIKKQTCFILNEIL